MMKEGWVRKKIKDICDKASSNIVQNKVMDNNGDYPLYGASGFVKCLDFYHRDEPYIGIVKDGSGVGRVNVYPAYSSLVGTMQYVIPKNGFLLGYIKYVLQSLNLAHFASGAAIPHIYFKDYGECTVLIPPLSEQESIVAELDKLNEILAKKQEQLKELDRLGLAIFYDMFGDPILNEKNWEMVPFSYVGTFGRGVSKHRPRNAEKLLGGTVPLIQTGDVARANMYITEYVSTYSEFGVAQSKIWKSGTLCITIAATIGKCAILTFDACFPDSVVGFVANSRVCNEYVYYIFGSIQGVLEENAPAVAQKNINLATLNALKIPLPPLDAQKEFVNKILRIEKQKQKIKQSIVEVQQLLDYTMNKYFG